MLEIELRKELICLALRLRQSHSWLQTANQRQVVPVVAEVIHDVRREQVDLWLPAKTPSRNQRYPATLP